jgi:hypothetical protein
LINVLSILTGPPFDIVVDDAGDGCAATILAVARGTDENRVVSWVCELAAAPDICAGFAEFSFSFDVFALDDSMITAEAVRNPAVTEAKHKPVAAHKNPVVAAVYIQGRPRRRKGGRSAARLTHRRQSERRSCERCRRYPCGLSEPH